MSSETLEDEGVDRAVGKRRRTRKSRIRWTPPRGRGWVAPGGERTPGSGRRLDRRSVLRNGGASESLPSTVRMGQDCRLLQLLSAKTPRSPPWVPRGAGQEGRESHPFAECSKGEGTDS